MARSTYQIHWLRERSLEPLPLVKDSYRLWRSRRPFSAVWMLLARRRTTRATRGENVSGSLVTFKELFSSAQPRFVFLQPVSSFSTVTLPVYNGGKVPWACSSGPSDACVLGDVLLTRLSQCCRVLGDHPAPWDLSYSKRLRAVRIQIQASSVLTQHVQLDIFEGRSSVEAFVSNDGILIRRVQMDGRFKSQKR